MSDVTAAPLSPTPLRRAYDRVAAVTKKPVTKYVAKGVLTVVMIVLAVVALGGSDLKLAASKVATLAVDVVALTFAVALTQVLAFATRLWTVFPRDARPSWATVARAFSFGELVNTYMPGRAGDVVKVFALTRRAPSEKPIEPASASTSPSIVDATGVMLADKGLDVLALLALLVVFGHELLGGIALGALRKSWIVAAVVAGLVLLFLALRRWLPSVWAKVRRGVASTVRAGRGLLTPRRLACGLGLSLAGFLAEVVMILLLASGVGASLSLAQGVLALLVLRLGIAVPVSVANLGAYEAAAVAGLSPFGVAAPDALAIGAIHHASQICAMASVAFAFWVRDRILARVARRELEPG